jgi:hypothetical protein
MLLGNTTAHKHPAVGAIQKRKQNLISIWNGEHHNDIGIEKLFRLFLAISQFLFLGTYIKQFFGNKSMAHQELAVDFFVLLKVLFPLIIIYNNWQGNNVLFAFVIWFLFETMLYVPTLIFASDIFSKPRSYRRSMLLFFFNYIEIVFSFAVIYSRGLYLNRPFEHWFDSIYFSFITAATVGYGDFLPITPFGKFLVSLQSLIFLIFVVLFLNFFTSRVQNKGYFDHNNHS